MFSLRTLRVFSLTNVLKINLKSKFSCFLDCCKCWLYASCCLQSVGYGPWMVLVSSTLTSKMLLRQGIRVKMMVNNLHIKLRSRLLGHLRIIFNFFHILQLRTEVRGVNFSYFQSSFRKSDQFLKWVWRRISSLQVELYRRKYHD